jgi:hypothetical protein
MVSLELRGSADHKRVNDGVEVPQIWWPEIPDSQSGHRVSSPSGSPATTSDRSPCSESYWSKK